MEVQRVDRELSNREIQLASLEILEKIDAICREQHIRYWVMYGTLIGAVRHHGFIPWDDDLDIAMPRPDYERFLTWFQKHADKMLPLVVLDGYRQELPFLITRVSDTTYKMIGEYGDEVPELGAFVDVYPIDGAGANRKAALSRKKRCAKLALKYIQAGNFRYNNKNASNLKRKLKRVHAALMASPAKYASKLNSTMTELSYESCSYLSCLEWPWDDPLVIDAESVTELYRTSFENTNVPIPRGYDKILRDQYGDYMQLPPESERVGHHYYSIVRRDNK